MTNWQELLKTTLKLNAVWESGDLTTQAGDITDIPPEIPVAIVFPQKREHVQQLMGFAKTHRLSLTARGSNLNVGGLGIGKQGAILVDFSKMNKIVRVNEEDGYAVLEPGVSFGQLKEYLDENYPELTMGYPTAPIRATVLGNCLMDGHVNLSFGHGLTSSWIQGLEVVGADGQIIKTGAWALTKHPVTRATLPDLSGLFIGGFGRLGLVTQFVVALQRKMKFSQRYFLLVKKRNACFDLMKSLGRTQAFQDLGSLSACTAKMLFGVMAPVLKDPNEPEMFFYVDLGAQHSVLFEAQKKILFDTIHQFRKKGVAVEDPLRVEDLITLNPSFARYAKFPMTLDFLVEHPGGGLTFVGTFGPPSELEILAKKCLEVYQKHNFPPAFVSRLISHGHLAVLHHVAVFDQKDEKEKGRVRQLNKDLAKISLAHGYLVYKAPDWVMKNLYASKIDPGFSNLWEILNRTLDRENILNPNRLPLKKP